MNRGIEEQNTRDRIPDRVSGRILAWPRQIDINPYFKRIGDGLERHGWQLFEFTFARAFFGAYQILHIHFPNFPFRNQRPLLILLRLFLTISSVALLRLRGCKVVWTVHNLANHERHAPRLEARFMRWFTRQLDLSIHLSESGREAAVRQYPALASRFSLVIPHIHYGEVSPESISRAQALNLLGLDTDVTVLAAVGQMRPYKNIPEFIRVFSQLRNDKLRLLIAGTIRDRHLETEIRHIASDSRVLLFFGVLSDQQLALYLDAATLVVAPYRDILNSGSALLALTRGRPILVPNQGAMAELQSKVGNSWVGLYAPPLTLESLEEAIQWARTPRPAIPVLDNFSPNTIVEAHARAFAALT